MMQFCQGAYQKMVDLRFTPLDYAISFSFYLGSQGFLESC